MASLRALKVEVYSFCQHSSHRAQPRHTRSAARSKITAGFSSGAGAVRFMLSYSSRRASAAWPSRSRRAFFWADSGTSSRRTRFPPNTRPGMARNSTAPAAVSHSRLRASSSREVSMAASAPRKKAPAERGRLAHLAASSAAAP